MVLDDGGEELCQQQQQSECGAVFTGEQRERRGGGNGTSSVQITGGRRGGMGGGSARRREARGHPFEATFTYTVTYMAIKPSEYSSNSAHRAEHDRPDLDRTDQCVRTYVCIIVFLQIAT